MIHLQVWCQVLEAARISSATSLNSCKLEEKSLVVFFQRKRCHPNKWEWRGWPLVGNEEMKLLYMVVMAFRFPHSLLRATQMKPRPRRENHTPRWPGINAVYHHPKCLDIGFLGAKKEQMEVLKKVRIDEIDYIYFFANETTTVINLAIMKA